MTICTYNAIKTIFCSSLAYMYRYKNIDNICYRRDVTNSDESIVNALYCNFPVVLSLCEAENDLLYC